MTLDTERYRDLFVAEADRLLLALASTLSASNALTTDAREVLRRLHTVKGMAATMSLSGMVLVAHVAEELAQRVASGGLEPNEEVLTLLQEGVLQLRHQLSAYSQSLPQPHDEAYEERVRTYLRTGATYAFQLLRPIDEEAIEPTHSSASSLADAQGTVAEALSAARRLRPLLDEAATLELDRIDGAVRRLYDQMVAMRTVPFSSVVPPLRRHIGRVAGEHSKAVAFDVVGEGVLIDGALLGRLHGALVALLTNAVVHGVESPEARLAAGKPSTGRVTLRAERVGRTFTLAVEDDGGGFDTATLGRGGRNPIGAALEGQSTAPRLDEHAGRGLGLDAVRHTIDRLAGSFSVQSRIGQGVVVRIIVPVLADLVPVWLVRAGGQVLALRSAQVRGMAEDQAPREPLLDLPLGPVGVTLSDGRVIGVEEVVEEGEYLVSAAPFPLNRLAHILGTSVAPEGEPLLIVEA